MGNKLRVWWIPQVPMKSFYVSVDTPEEGKKVMDILAAYDAFQLQNRVKPDYCNAGGLQMYNPETAAWEDWYLETEDHYFDNVDEYIAQSENAEKIEEFFDELFKQIDWDKIDRMTK